MFGFYYAAIGLIFGVLCTVKAKEIKISNTEWFTLGFAFNVLAYIVLIVFAAKTKTSKRMDYTLNGSSSAISYKS